MSACTDSAALERGPCSITHQPIHWRGAACHLNQRRPGLSHTSLFAGKGPLYDTGESLQARAQVYRVRPLAVLVRGPALHARAYSRRGAALLHKEPRVRVGRSAPLERSHSVPHEPTNSIIPHCHMGLTQTSLLTSALLSHTSLSQTVATITHDPIHPCATRVYRREAEPACAPSPPRVRQGPAPAPNRPRNHPWSEQGTHAHTHSRAHTHTHTSTRARACTRTHARTAICPQGERGYGRRMRRARARWRGNPKGGQRSERLAPRPRDASMRGHAGLSTARVTRQAGGSSGARRKIGRSPQDRGMLAVCVCVCEDMSV